MNTTLTLNPVGAFPVKEPRMVARVPLHKNTVPLAAVRKLVFSTVQFLARLAGQQVTIKALRLVGTVKSAIKYKDASFPQQVFIEINTHCNRRCWYCPNSVAPIYQREIEPGHFRRILERLADINWTGPVAYHFINEPLLNSRLAEYISMTRHMLPKAIPILFTNGDHLTLERASELVEAGLLRCTITRHEPQKPGWHERIDQICQSWPEVFHCHPVAARPINVAGVVGHGRPAEDFSPKLPFCRAPRRALVIRWNGDISLCCCDYQQNNTFGNLLQSPILDLWNSPRWDQVRKELAHGLRSGICVNCTGVA